MNSQDILFQLTNVGSSPIHKSDGGSTSGSNTSSPRRWTEIFSKRRVKTPTISTPSTASSNSSYYEKSPISNLPKPSKYLGESTTSPFSDLPETSMNIRNQRRKVLKSWKNEPCCICSDLCSVRRSTERIIQLQCKHMCHEDCLIVSLNPGVCTENFYDALPHCTFCKAPCVPLETEIMEKIRTHVLTGNNDPKLREHFINSALSTGTKRISYPSSLKPAPRITSMGNDGRILLRQGSKRPSTFRGSTISGVCSIVSSSSKSDRNAPSLHIQRQYFMLAFFSSFENFKPWEVDSKYGLMRLIDNFLISLDGKSFHHYVCYLFDGYLIICSPKINEDSNVIQFIEHHILQLNKPALIELIDATTLELTLTNGEKIKIKPYDSDTQPLEKWITALFDPSLNFGSADFTSIPFPEFLSAIPQSNDTGTIIVRRQLSNEMKNTEKVRESTILTSISSILSIKRSRPKELNMILQLDTKKLGEASKISIKNFLTVVNWKFMSLNCCVVDSDGNIVKCNDSSNIANMWDKNWKALQPFSPEYIHKNWYENKGHICRNTGVLVVSNASMDSDKSCLFRDYKIFADLGKRHANELKVKVGFLNCDYSEKIREMVEVEDWNELLEVVAYAFNLSFDDEFEEEDEFDSSEDESLIATDSCDDKISFDSNYSNDIISDSTEIQNVQSPTICETPSSQIDKLISDISDAIEEQSQNSYSYL